MALDTRISFVISREDRLAIASLAARDGRNFSSEIRRLVRQRIDEAAAEELIGPERDDGRDATRPAVLDGEVAPTRGT